MVKLFVALDVNSEEKAWDIIDSLLGLNVGFKIGKELFTALGPKFVEKVISKGFQVFLDLKFHDIPNTVSRAVRVASDMGVSIVNLHALGGRRMMEEAMEEVNSLKVRPYIIAVTILTSLDNTDLQEIGISDTVENMVLKLSKLAYDSGMDGVVASPLELRPIKSNIADSFKVLTPGIRPSWAVKNDQKRITTPRQAITWGADWIVVGRPITMALDPVTACMKILEEIDDV